MKTKIVLIFWILIFLGGCVQQIQDLNIEKSNIMDGKKVLMIVAPENFRDEEYMEPRNIFENDGLEVIVASKEVQEAKGMFGTTIKIDLDIEDVNVEDYDTVVFVGGSGSSVYYNDSIVLNIAREAYNKGKIIGAICIAPGILAKAGILEGKKATIWDSGNREFIKILEESGAIYTGADVEQDGNIITANGPHAAQEFGEKIVQSLK